MLVLVLISCFNSCYSLNPTCWLMPIMCTMRRLGCGAAWLLAATATAGSPSSSSLSASAPYPAELCSLNGEWDEAGGRCTCDAAWRSGEPDYLCATLAVLPVARNQSGYHNASAASWGGNVVLQDGMYHLNLNLKKIAFSLSLCLSLCPIFGRSLHSLLGRCPIPAIGPILSEGIRPIFGRSLHSLLGQLLVMHS